MAKETYGFLSLSSENTGLIKHLILSQSVQLKSDFQMGKIIKLKSVLKMLLAGKIKTSFKPMMIGCPSLLSSSLF